MSLDYREGIEEQFFLEFTGKKLIKKLIIKLQIT